MEEKFLPVGSVVRLKDGKKNLMIIGFMTTSPETGDKQYDYLGALYPEGVISSDMNFLFDHDGIEEILFKGYVTDEEVTFKQKLVELVTNGTVNGQPVNVDGFNVQSNVAQQQPQFVQSQPQMVQNQTVVQPQMFSNNTNQQ